jgi:hypothetical protein
MNWPSSLYCCELLAKVDGAASAILALTSAQLKGCLIKFCYNCCQLAEKKYLLNVVQTAEFKER